MYQIKCATDDIEYRNPCTESQISITDSPRLTFDDHALLRCILFSRLETIEIVQALESPIILLL